MRYQVMSDQHSAGQMQKFFETEDFQEAKDFAMKLAFFNDCKVSVMDEKFGQPIRDFDDPKHW